MPTKPRSPIAEMPTEPPCDSLAELRWIPSGVAYESLAVRKPSAWTAMPSPPASTLAAPKMKLSLLSGKSAFGSVTTKRCCHCGALVSRTKTT
jgi:hypothetical protein